MSKNKFDLAEKIKLKDLLRALLDNKKSSPTRFLKDYLKINKNYQDIYFNWGRNAFFYLFKNLKYKEIVFPAFTCPTLTEAAEKAGKKVVLAEIRINTFNLDIDKIPQNTKCLVVVHTFGNPVNIKEIRRKFPNIFIVEDCAHSLFAKINSQYTGSAGEVVLFSMYKQIPNINGAILLVNTPSEVIVSLKNVVHTSEVAQMTPRRWKYLKRLIYKVQGPHQFLLNYKRKTYLPSIEVQDTLIAKPSSLVNSLFIQGLKNLEKKIEQKRKIASFYIQEIKKYPDLDYQKSEKNSLPSYYQFPVILNKKYTKKRDKIVMFLRQNNIFIDRLWFRSPIALKKFNEFKKACPKALVLSQTIINLPIDGSYSKQDVKYLFKMVNRAVKAVG